MTEIGEEVVELPEGVKRYVMYCSEPPKAAPAGDWIRVSDLPVIQAQVLAGVKERLLDGLAKLDNEINEYDGLPVGAVEEMIEKTLATLNPNEGEGSEL